MLRLWVPLSRECVIRRERASAVVLVVPWKRAISDMRSLSSLGKFTVTFEVFFVPPRGGRVEALLWGSACSAKDRNRRDVSPVGRRV